ncbi:response regulator [Desulfomonile tiedjei]|uniref:Response regulator with CheY-like receiver, AAA-type ATPase, and DNA-binding domains n=1 Tax=Desulfomonile tiedjei (strain ATCC 49306 / DSM 6799 / DCB-1) TaxID=706587 RepID=I4CBY3_DESTA|nr:response regulator [Desulfomonile tiedjei]AFM27074.1 response regulator with CheY-like receiver, AAA-type ATPase, and DNA-binding domains [Desulfomonile tiedjei DSM 6799]
MDVKVLLVDDEKEFVETLAERMETRGLKVSRAYSGDECLERISEEKADVVILDVLMPGKDGIETLKEIKQKYPLIEVIMLTGHGTIETAIDGLKLGAYDYLMKPTETADLVSKILRAYARKSEQEERIRRAEIDKIVAARGW